MNFDVTTKTGTNYTKTARDLHMNRCDEDGYLAFLLKNGAKIVGYDATTNTLKVVDLE